MKSDVPPSYQAHEQHPPPPPGFYPPQPQPVPVAMPMATVSTITVLPTTIVGGMGSQPQSFVCRSCNAQIITQVRPRSTTKTHLFALLLCLIGCWPCVCIPYCTDSCRNIDHYCPHCQAYIGSYIG